MGSYFTLDSAPGCTNCRVWSCWWHLISSSSSQCISPLPKPLLVCYSEGLALRGVAWYSGVVFTRSQQEVRENALCLPQQSMVAEVIMTQAQVSATYASRAQHTWGWTAILATTLKVSTGSLRWRHDKHDGVSNHQPHDCLFNRLFRCGSKKTSKLRVTGLCEGNSPMTGDFPAQRASNAENVSIWWRHHIVIGIVIMAVST